MRKKIMIYILMAVCTLFLLTGCKKNVGTPEDNAVTDESDDKKEDTDQEKKVFGFCGIDMSNPFYATLKDSVQSALEEQGDKLLIKDPAGAAEYSDTGTDRRRCGCCFSLPGGLEEDRTGTGCSGGG